MHKLNIAIVFFCLALSVPVYASSNVVRTFLCPSVDGKTQTQLTIFEKSGRERSYPTVEVLTDISVPNAKLVAPANHYAFKKDGQIVSEGFEYMSGRSVYSLNLFYSGDSKKNLFRRDEDPDHSPADVTCTEKVNSGSSS